MRTLAILIAASTAIGAIYQVLEATRTGMTSPFIGLAVVAALALGGICGALALWRGARWGAGLILVVAVLGAVVVQQNHIFFAFGGSVPPLLAAQLPYVAWGAVAAVAVLIALSWKGLGKR